MHLVVASSQRWAQSYQEGTHRNSVYCMLSTYYVPDLANPLLLSKTTEEGGVGLYALMGQNHCPENSLFASFSTSLACFLAWDFTGLCLLRVTDMRMVEL